MKKRIFCCTMLAVTLSAGVFYSGDVRSDAADADEVGVSELSDQGTAAPEAWGATPSQNQYKYMKDELAAFVHFGPNTYNNLEWGYNNGTYYYADLDPSEIFCLEEDFDAYGIVKTLADAGFKKVIITAKHHDGFCIWQSEYTDYDMGSVDYKDGQGDILAEISEACTYYDMDMGLYLSPWDVAEESFGYIDADGNPTTEENDANGDYNDYYNNQLAEILSNDKYGNNGHFVEVWMDGANGYNTIEQDYDFVRWFTTIQSYEGKDAGYDDDCLLFGAASYTTVRWIGNELGLASSTTWAKSIIDREANTIDSNRIGSYTEGYADGNQWTVPECDARITSGWFWGTSKNTPKTLDELADMYFSSVGNGATLLLNVPPNTSGTLDDSIKNRVLEFGEAVSSTFERNLAKGASVTASEVRGNDLAYSPENVLDGDDGTYWTMEDGSVTGSITIDLGETTVFDVVTVEEEISLGQRVSGFTIEYKNGDGEWTTFDTGTTIGSKHISRQKPVRADKLRITITDSYAVPLISEIGIYKAAEAFELGTGIPAGLDIISATDTDTDDGEGFTYGEDWSLNESSDYIDGYAIEASEGASATVVFSGSMVYLYGTTGSGYGTAEIYIDGKKAGEIDAGSTQTAYGQLLFQEEELEYGEHTMEILVTEGTLSIEAAAVLNNDGAGMVVFETDSVEMEEDSQIEVTVRRIGGSSGRITVDYENNPGSAVQGNYDVDGISGTLVFEDGETEKTILITTKRDTDVDGELDFTVDLKNAGGGAVIGTIRSLKVTILDMDDPARIEEARTLLEECAALSEDMYDAAELAQLKTLASELESMLEVYELGYIDVKYVLEKASELQAARAELSLTDCFYMPDSENTTKTLEAELFTLDASGAADSTKYVRITENSAASNGYEVNWFEQGNKISMSFYASEAGSFEITATYRSGRTSSSPNALVWDGTNISSGSVDVDGDGDSSVYRTVTFNVEIAQPGEGELVFTADSKGGPVLDKFEITYLDAQEISPVSVTGITLSASEIELTAENTFAFLTASLEPEDAESTEITYESSDPDVAYVTAGGMVVGLSTGEAVITVSVYDGKISASCAVSVDLRSDDEKADDDESEVSGTDASQTQTEPQEQQASQKQQTQQTQSDTQSQVAVGTICEYNGARYRITESGQDGGSVTFVKPLTKTKKTVRIPDSIKIDGKTYKVTAIANNAFKNNKKLKSVTIGKNVVTIGKNAFAGARNLKKITIKSKLLKKVGKNAFKGINAKCTVKVPKAKLKAYQKLLKKKGQKSTVKIKR